MNQHKYFFLSLFLLIVFYVAGVFIHGDGNISGSPLMVAGFFSSAFGFVKKAVGTVAKVASVIPGVGTVVAGAAAAIGALSSGGQVQTVTPATTPGQQPTVQTVGTYVPQAQVSQAGISGDLMNFKFMGIPLLPVGLILLAFSMYSRRRR